MQETGQRTGSRRGMGAMPAALMCAAMLLSQPTFAHAQPLGGSSVPRADVALRQAGQSGDPQAAGQATRAPDEAAPGNETVPGEQLEGTIRAVRGVLTQVRMSPEDEWVPAAVGMRVPVGGELRTGPRSMIQFAIPPDQVITIDRATTITLLQATRQGERVRTDIGMLRGRTTYQASDPEIVHEASLRAPNATNAVRGTKSFGISDDSLYGPMVFSTNTPTTVTNQQGYEVAFGGENETSEMQGDKFSEGEQAFLNAIVNPTGARSSTEMENLLVGRLPGLGGTELGGTTGDLRDPIRPDVLREQFNGNGDIGPGPIIPPEMLPQGTLFAVLYWQTPSDLDIFSIDSQGFMLSTYPGMGEGFAGESPNGGFAGPDLTAGPGVEYIVYPGPEVPLGDMEVGVSLFEGVDTPFLIQVFYMNEQVGNDFTGIVGPNNPMQSTIFVPGGHDR